MTQVSKLKNIGFWSVARAQLITNSDEEKRMKQIVKIHTRIHRQIKCREQQNTTQVMKEMEKNPIGR